MELVLGHTLGCFWGPLEFSRQPTVKLCGFMETRFPDWRGSLTLLSGWDSLGVDGIRGCAKYQRFRFHEGVSPKIHFGAQSVRGYTGRVCWGFNDEVTANGASLCHDAEHCD